MHSLEKFPRKKDRYNKKYLGAIGKKESENDVVWIILQARQFKWKNLNILKVKGDGTDARSILYDNPNHREFFLNLTLCRTYKKQQNLCQLFSSSLQYLAQSSMVRENGMAVAKNCETVGRSKG